MYPVAGFGFGRLAGGFSAAPRSARNGRPVRASTVASAVARAAVTATVSAAASIVVSAAVSVAVKAAGLEALVWRSGRP
jgi:hypothetical protein